VFGTTSKTSTTSTNYKLRMRKYILKKLFYSLIMPNIFSIAIFEILHCRKQVIV